jgi:hypothetical protein
MSTQPNPTDSDLSRFAGLGLPAELAARLAQLEAASRREWARIAATEPGAEPAPDGDGPEPVSLAVAISRRRVALAFEPLHPRQRQAVELLAAGRPVGEVARILDVHRSTLWAWQGVEAFCVELARRRHELAEVTREQARRCRTKALARLEALLSDPALEPKDAIAACRVALAAAPQNAPEPLWTVADTLAMHGLA